MQHIIYATKHKATKHETSAAIINQHSYPPNRSGHELNHEASVLRSVTR